MIKPNGISNRVTCKRPRPNQHFQELLESLYRDAVKNRNSIAPALKIAISSLEKYPLPLHSGSECAILKGFDKRLCRYIDSQLHERKIKKLKSDAVRDTSQEEINHANTEMCNGKTNNESKNLKPNTMKCTCPKTGNYSNCPHNINTKDLAIIDLTDNNNTESKDNNHTALHKQYLGPETLSSFQEKVKKDLLFDSMQRNNRLKKWSTYDVNLALCGNWESLRNDKQLSQQNCSAELCRTIFQPDKKINKSEDEDSSGDNSLADYGNINSSDESIGNDDNQHQSYIYGDEVPQNQPCESGNPAADAFQLHFKEKTKKDNDEINKCTLPSKKLIPAYRSGAYAILVALFEQRNECPYRDCLTKDELIQKAQKHTDKSFKKKMLDSNYTAWADSKKLINKGLIRKINFDNNNEDFYTLTPKGTTVAINLMKGHSPKVTLNDVIFHGQCNDRVPSLEDVVLAPPPPVASLDEEHNSVFIEMPPGTFDVVMLIDKRENFDKNILGNTYYCKFEERSLTIGDFVWIARSKKTGQELVLPYIVERKRMDDLASSIKDGRFHEQKFRLRKCGLNNVIYLVENYKKKVQHGLPASTLMQAVVNTNVLEEFKIVQTESWAHTLNFLETMSEKLINKYWSVVIRGCNRDTEGRELMTFEFFNKFSCKNKPLTIRDTFIKMLLQLKGLSVEKALAITNKYSTPRALIKAYEKCPEKEGELLLANLKFNHFSQNVGPSVSKTVYKLFSKLEI